MPNTDNGTPIGPIPGSTIRRPGGEIAVPVQEFTVVADLLQCARSEALSLCRESMEAVTPGLRELLQTFLQESLGLQAEIAEYSMQHGYYRPFLQPTEQIEHDLHLASAQPVPDRPPLA